MPPTSLCWPGDPDYLDGRTEIRLPFSQLLQAYWDADVLDINDPVPDNIISVGDDFKVRFRVELVGPLWQCVAGDWSFELGFTPIGPGQGFNLSGLLPAGSLQLPAWKGCDTLCIELEVTVAAGTIQAGLYELGARFWLTCCGQRTAVTGYESLEEYEWFTP